jgi:enoyl-CoA hydratase/carnithine racemase
MNAACGMGGPAQHSELQRMSSNILFTREAGVATLRLNRPEKKNAINLAMYAALADALTEAERDPDVRAILITGVGDTFTAGNDLNDFANRPPAGTDAPAPRFLRQLSQVQKPLVAAVDGNAVGVGFTMLLHCDLVFVSERVKLRAPFVDLGLVPEAASTLLLPRLVGYQRAAEILFLCDVIDAEKARQLGLVSAVLPVAELELHARRVCERLARKAPTALRLTKALLRESAHATVPERLAHEGEIFALQLRSPEVREAIAAFFEKRAPDFSKSQ